MITNNNNTQLYVNGKLIEMGDEGLSIRLNNTLYDPTKLTASTTSYSYTFDIPATKENCKIFDNINVPSKKNKFSGRYSAELYSEETLIFSGYLKVTSFEDGEIKCNLYIPKVNTLEEIFGETKLSDIKWYVPFDGVSTINEVNNNKDTDYFFPWVAYGLPNKVPYKQSKVNKYYTDKKTIDEYTRFYYNSFVPSVNIKGLLEKCFEYKGLKLSGDILTDPFFKDCYLSNNIASGQDPLYNLGNSKLGSSSLQISFSNYNITKNETITDIGIVNSYDLEKVPHSYDDNYNVVYESPLSKKKYDDGKYDYQLSYDMSNLENIAEYANDTFASLATTTQTQLSPIVIDNKFGDDNNMVRGGKICIPSDGWYKITINGAIQLLGDAKTPHSDNVKEYYQNMINNHYERPLEFQLLRYRPSEDSDDTLNHNYLWGGIYPNENYEYTTDTIVPTTTTRYQSIPDRISSFILPPEERTLCYDDVEWRSLGQRNESGGIPITNDGNKHHTALMDVSNNPNYICGCMQSGEGKYVGYMRDGGSWNEEEIQTNESIYNCESYYKAAPTWFFTRYDMFLNGNGYNKNEIKKYNYPIDYIYTNSGVDMTNWRNEIYIKLKKNDILIPFINVRANVNDEKVTAYPFGANVHIFCDAVAPSNFSKEDIYYKMPSIFEKELNLGNFMNQETKISEFISNIQKTFNLDFIKDGNSVILNKNKKDNISIPIVNLDERVNADEYSFENLDLPSMIGVTFKIDEEEEGFYQSVVDTGHINDNDWKKYADIGSNKIVVSTQDDATELSHSTSFSYDWNNKFNILDYKKLLNNKETETHIADIPIIGKSEWWIRGYRYDEMAQYDGRSMTQRFWFRQTPSTFSKNIGMEEGKKIEVPVGGLYNEKGVKWVEFVAPSLTQGIIIGDFYLTYENGEKTLLNRFFNIDYNSSNEIVNVDCYLSPIEYKKILDGGAVLLDDNIYKVMKISGFDPNGINKTKLQLTQM